MLLRKSASSKTDSIQQGVDNAAKTLLANLRFMSVDNPISTVVVTSAVPNEGKTFVAANLARAMATSGVRTLVVECDMRRRSMAHQLHVHAQHGLYSVMADEVGLLEAVVPTGVQFLHFLDAEPHIPNPSDLLNSRRFARLMEEAKREFGYIVFDTPPVGTFVDAAVLGAKVDAVLMVVREQFTNKADINRAAEQLKTANVPLSGIVMNFCERHSNGYYYYDYYYHERESSRSTGPALKQPQNETASVRSWNNAPKIAEEELRQPVMPTAQDSYAQARPRHAQVPDIGNTNVIDRDEIRKSQ